MKEKDRSPENRPVSRLHKNFLDGLKIFLHSGKFSIVIRKGLIPLVRSTTLISLYF